MRLPCNEDSSDGFYHNQKVAALSHLFYAAFEEYAKAPKNTRSPTYHQTLRVVAGLSTAAILHAGDDFTVSRPHFALFMSYSDFMSHRDRWQPFAHALAELVVLALKAFDRLDYPMYYTPFFDAVWDATLPLFTVDYKIKLKVKEMLMKVLFREKFYPLLKE
jgi:hypothetical protein